MTPVRYRTVDVEGLEVFYREAGNPGVLKLLLLHGFPTSSHMFRDLIPRLAHRFHAIAPDLPGFGRTAMPGRDEFGYTFDNLARVVERFTELVGLDRFALNVFDYDAPTGFRIAMRHPERITAIISQNGNAYEEGRATVGIRSVRTGGNRRRPTGSALRLPGPGGDALAIYPRRARRDRRLPRRLFARRLLPDAAGSRRDPARPVPRLREQRGAVSGLPGLLPQAPAAAPGGLGPDDPFFLPAGAEAFRRDIPQADVRFFETGHFALETHAEPIAAAIREFLSG